jgi:hypothetical protein
LNNELIMKERRVFDLERRIKELQTQFSERCQLYEKEHQSMNRQLHAKSEEIQQLIMSTQATSSKRKTTVFHSPSAVFEEKPDSKKPSLNKIMESTYFDEDDDEVLAKKVPTI